MTYMFILLTFIFGAYASTKQPDADVDILKILADLQTQAKISCRFSKESKATHQFLASGSDITKKRISILEELLGKEETFNVDVSDFHPKQNQPAPEEYVTEENVHVDKQDEHNHDELNIFTKGIAVATRLVARAEGPVAFQAHLNNDITHIGIHQKIAFDHVTLNLGNSYHNRHGLFIAPRPGIYIFSGSLLAHHRKVVEMQFVKNGVALGGGILSNSGAPPAFDQGSATFVTQLDIGVWIENLWPDDTSLRATPNTCFMGCPIMDI